MTGTPSPQSPSPAQPLLSTSPSTEVTIVTRTLSLLPTVVGVVGIVATVLAGVISGVVDGPQGWPAVAAATAAVAVTVVSGGSYGLYAGLVILAAGGMVADGGPTPFELTALPISLLIVHEIVRFSLDARVPSRFGPGVVLRYLGRLIGCCLLIVAISLLVQAAIDQSPSGDLWVPIGLAACALPLFARRGAELVGHRAIFRFPALRAGIGIALVFTVVLLVGLSATARPEDSPGPDSEAVARTTTTISTLEPADRDSIGEGFELPSWVLLLAAIAAAIVIYLVLRRPEAIFQLEEVDRRVEDNAFDLALANLANAEDETVDVDEDALARLLWNLQLDIAAELDPGRAIRFGYATIEQRLTDLGLNRSAVETEREFLVRALPTLGDAGAAMTRLTRLFERARFGHEPIDEGMRQEALAAIDELLAASARSGDGTASRDPSDRREGDQR